MRFHLQFTHLLTGAPYRLSCYEVGELLIKINIEEFKRLHYEGYGSRRLAAHFGVRVTTIKKKLKVYGLTPHAPSVRTLPDDVTLKEEAQYEGPRALAQRYGCDEGTVGRHLRRLGIHRPFKLHESSAARSVLRRRFEFPALVRRTCYLQANGLCHWCHQPVDHWKSGTYHHIVPIVDGGDGSLKNCMLLHRECHETNFSELHNGRRWKFHEAYTKMRVTKLQCPCGEPSWVRSGHCPKCCANAIASGNPSILGVSNARLRQIRNQLEKVGLLPTTPKCPCGHGGALGNRGLCMACWTPQVLAFFKKQTMKEVARSTGLSLHTVDMILHPRRSKPPPPCSSSL